MKTCKGGFVIAIAALACVWATRTQVSAQAGSIPASTQRRSPTPAAARQLTVVVRAAPPDDVTSSIHDVVDTIKPKAPEAAQKLATSTTAVAGSGFVVQGHDGRALVVTDRDFVDRADHVQVTGDDGRTYEGNPVYIDSDYGIALVEFVGAAPFDEGLQLESSQPVDGQAVQAAGYAGLGQEQSWRVANGTVRDACVDVGKAGRCLIEHDASMDEGNSGGPLLDDAGHVLGINVMSDRSHASLAVPSSVIAAALTAVHRISDSQSDPQWKADQLVQSCQQLKTELASAEPKLHLLERMMSSHFFAHDPQELAVVYAVTLRLQAEHEELRDIPLLPLLRLGAGALLWDALQSAGGLAADESCTGIDPGDRAEITHAEQVRQTVKLANGDTVELAWRFEHGRWHFAAMSLVQENEGGPKDQDQDAGPHGGGVIWRTSMHRAPGADLE